MNELVRVTAPGGRIILVTWCHRELQKDEVDLKPFEQRLLQKINDGMHSPLLVLLTSFLMYMYYSFFYDDMLFTSSCICHIYV